MLQSGVKVHVDTERAEQAGDLAYFYGPYSVSSKQGGGADVVRQQSGEAASGLERPEEQSATDCDANRSSELLHRAHDTRCGSHQVDSLAATPVASVVKLAADLRLERSASGLTVRFPHPVGLSARNRIGAECGNRTRVICWEGRGPKPLDQPRSNGGHTAGAEHFDRAYVAGRGSLEAGNQLYRDRDGCSVRQFD